MRQWMTGSWWVTSWSHGGIYTDIKFKIDRTQSTPHPLETLPRKMTTLWQRFVIFWYFIWFFWHHFVQQSTVLLRRERNSKGHKLSHSGHRHLPLGIFRFPKKKHPIEKHPCDENSECDSILTKKTKVSESSDRQVLFSSTTKGNQAIHSAKKKMKFFSHSPHTDSGSESSSSSHGFWAKFTAKLSTG